VSTEKNFSSTTSVPAQTVTGLRKFALRKFGFQALKNEIRLLKFGFILNSKVLLNPGYILGWNYFIFA